MSMIKSISPFVRALVSSHKKLVGLGIGLLFLIGISGATLVAHAQWYPGTGSGITSITYDGSCLTDINGGAGTLVTSFNSDGSPSNFYTTPNQYCEMYKSYYIDMCKGCGEEGPIEKEVWRYYNSPYVAVDNTVYGTGSSEYDTNTSFSSTPGPTAAISASPSSITSGNGSVLSWSSTNATSCTGDSAGTGYGSIAASGSSTVYPTSSTTYTITCTGAGGTTAPVSATVTVTAPPPLPDLISTTAPVGSTATVGTPVTFTGGTITNQGTATATNFPNILQFVNQAGTVQTGIVAASPSSMTLAVNASAAATGTYTFPSAGTYYARFCANYNTTPANVITESTYSNNCGPISGAITVSATGRPDITAAQGAGVIDPVNTPITLTSLVSDFSSFAASSNFHNIVEICNKVDCSGSISVTLAGNDISSLAVNASKRVSASYTPTTLGTLYYQICGNLNTSWANTITESNYGNNCGGWATLTVGTPITASCSVSPTTVQAGSPVTWTASASGGSGSLTYTWGGSVTGTGTSVPQTYNTAGTYSGTVTVTDAGSDTSGPVTCTTGGGGSPGGGANTTVYSCIPALSAAPSTVNAGGQSTLTWSENALCASSCLFSDGHPAGLSGTYQVTPPTPPSGNTDTYSVTCGVPANTNQTIITVNVATATISANPNRVASGGTTALTWSASPNILTACTITRNGVDMGATFDTLSGTSVSDPIHITTQTVYKFSCTGPQNATASATAIVNVLPAFTEF